MKLNCAILLLAVLSSTDHVLASGRRRRVIRGEEPRNPMIEHRELKGSKSSSKSSGSGSGRSSRSSSGDGDCGDDYVLLDCLDICDGIVPCMLNCCDNGYSSRSGSRSSRSSRSSSSKSGGGGGGSKSPKGEEGGKRN